MDERMFTSGGPGPGGRFRRWASTYRAPLAMTAAFCGLILVFAIAPNSSRSAPERTPTVETEPTPDRSPCPACSIGERCEESTGRCVLVEETPLPCNEGFHYDEEEGFCVPDPTPEPTLPPTRTLAPDATPRTTPRPTPPPETPAATPEQTPSGTPSGTANPTEAPPEGD